MSTHDIIINLLGLVIVMIIIHFSSYNSDAQDWSKRKKD